MWERIVLNLVSNAFKFTFEGEIRVALRHEGADAVLTVRRHRHGHRPRRSSRGCSSASGACAARARARTRAAASGSRSSRSWCGCTAARSRRESELGARLDVHGPRPARRRRRTAGAGGDARRAAPPPTSRRPCAGCRTPRTRSASWRPSAPGSRPATAGRAARARILIADDNADLRDYLERLLARHWDVETVGDGRAALAAVARAPPGPDPLRRDDARARRLRPAGGAARRPVHVAAAGDHALGAGRRGGGRRGPLRGRRRLPAQAVLLARADRPRAGEPRPRRAAPGRRARDRAPRPAAARPGRRRRARQPRRRASRRCSRSWPSAPARWSGPSGRSRASRAAASAGRAPAAPYTRRRPAHGRRRAAARRAAARRRGEHRRRRGRGRAHPARPARLDAPGERAALRARAPRRRDAPAQPAARVAARARRRGARGASTCPGSSEASVGGDWYDAIALGDDDGGAGHRRRRRARRQGRVRHGPAAQRRARVPARGLRPGADARAREPAARHARRRLRHARVPVRRHRPRARCATPTPGTRRR